MSNEVPDKRANPEPEALSSLRVGGAGSPRPQEVTCADCGAPLNEGEAKTFTVCDVCWDKEYKGAVSPAPAPQFKALASAMKKVLPPALLAEVIAHLDPLTPFVEFLRTYEAKDSTGPGPV